MEPSTHFSFISVLAILVLSVFPNLSNGQGLANLQLSTGTAGGFQVQSDVGGDVSLQINEQSGSTLDVVNDLLKDLVKKTTVPPPTGFDDAWANSVMQGSGALIEAYTILIKQFMGQCTQSAGVDDAFLDEIMQATSENSRIFNNIFAQLIQLIAIKNQTGAVDAARANAIMQMVGQNDRAFTYLFARLADLMSKTGASVNAIDVIQAARVCQGALGNVIKKLVYVPITSSGPDEASVNEIMEANNAVIQTFTSLTKHLTFTPPPPPPPPPKKDNTVILQITALSTGAFTNVMKQLASMPDSCTGINNAWASSIRKSTGVATKTFIQIIEQLLFLQSDGTVTDNIAIKQASSQSIVQFSNVMKQLAVLVSGQTDAIDNAWASVITVTADVVAGTFGNLLIQLANMPTPSSERYNAWASKVMHSSDVLTKAFAILIDELVLAQSTGMIKAVTPDQASAIIQATSQSTATFTQVIKLYVC